MSWASRSSSAIWIAGYRIRRAERTIACSADPLKKVCSTWRSAVLFARSRPTVGRYTYRGPVLLVPDVPFVFENPQHRPDRRVAGRIRQRGLDFGRRRATLAIKDVHDLPFAAAEVVVGLLTHQR